MQRDEESGERRAREVLRKHWGYASFRPGQWPAIRSVLAGKDVLAVLPTGGGKSVCYQVPGVMKEGLTLVVSPLIALMQDQVAGLRAHGLPATFINSTLPRREIEQRWTDVEHGRYQFLYLAPERLQTERFEARAERLDVSLLAVDEAHCISEWGHHFRPAYREIPEARALLGRPTTIAVTATATPEVRSDIREHLGLSRDGEIIQGFDRPNIVWSVFRDESKRERVLEVVRNVRGSGLLYASTRRSVEQWARRLQQEGETVGAYHAGMETAEREAMQDEWLQGERRLVVATNAFGMGIDKADVRFVIHLDMPGSLEAYYQEAGRAGRDGERAYAVLLWKPGDETTQHALIESSHPDAEAVRRVYEAACSLAQIPIGTLPDEPVVLDFEAVGRVADLSLSQVRVAVNLLERQGTWQTLPVRSHHALLRFRQSVGDLRGYADAEKNEALSRFLRSLIRAVHADAFSTWWEVDLRMLARRTGLERERLLRGLAFLQEREVLSWRPPGVSTQVWLAEPRASKLSVDDRSIRRSRKRAEARLDDMMRYARSVTCRRHFLLSYFGEESPEECGACDICLGRHEAVVITPEDEPVMRHILRRVADDTPREAWFDDSPASAYHVDELVDWLVQKGYLQIETPLEEAYALTEKAYALMEQWEPRRKGQ